MDRTISIDDLNPRQYEIFHDIISTPASETKMFTIRSSRQAGKTFVIERLAIYLMFEKPNVKGAFISASWKQFTKCFKELCELCPGLISNIDKGNSIIYYLNGSSLAFFTARNHSAIVGNTFDYIICDEVALWPETAMSYITPVLAAKKEGKAIFASTPRGRGPFYELCMAGMDETNKFYKHYRMSYLDNEEYDLREVEEKRKTMPEAIFRSEYGGEFTFGKSNVFGEFSKYQTITKWPKYDPTKQYYFGIDWAGTGEDSTILTIIDNEGNTVFIFDPETTSLPEQADLMSNIINDYNAIGYGECNGLGIGGTQMLELKCVGKVTKFWMTNESKNELVTNFLVNLKKGHIQLPSVDLNSKLDNEMCSFIVSRTNGGKLAYSHEKGFHDDTVDSLMMAHFALKNLRTGGQIFDTDSITEDFAIEDIKNTYQLKSMTQMKQEYGSFVDALYPD